ncbi:MAG: rhomboid family intramembrane serine protease [Pseudomonadota bacterium]
MIPISDQNPTRTTPYVNYTLIALNILAFALESWLLSLHGDSYVVAGYGLVPSRFSADPAGEAFTILTSMFMHGGIGHLAGNMLFLWIFGDNVEDAIGHGRYVLFYLLCGLCAAGAQVFAGAASQVPVVGASGAIAGVLGAYLVLYPRVPITVFMGFFLMVWPAWVVIGFWAVLQLTGGLSALGLESGGGVAFFEHIGGFLGGVLAIRPFMLGRERAQVSRFTSFRHGHAGGRFGLPRAPGGSGLPGPGPGRWDSWR